MRLGSIVGIIIAGILITAGIIMCITGIVSAGGSDKALFMQVDDSGTHYIQPVSSEVTKISLGYKDANITIKGGAEKSQIEFTNFNPNLYSISETTNVITFDEVADITSMLDLGSYGFSFKGLRYALDPRNNDFDDMQKSIVITLAPDSPIKIIDIDANVSNVKIEDVSLAGDLLINVESGTVDIVSTSANSTISITGEKLTTSIEGVTSKVFRYSGGETTLAVKESVFTDIDINAESGRVDYKSAVTLDDYIIGITSETGGLLVNAKPVTSPFAYEPVVENEEEVTTNKLKIKAVSAGINLEYPTAVNSENTNGVKN